MQQVTVAGTPLDVSRLCLGAMFFGTSVDRAASFAVLDAYREAGGNFVDTANNYAFWASDQATGDESETLVGAWLADRSARDDIVLATKVGARPLPGSRSLDAVEGLGARAIVTQVEGSLRRLGVDHVDLLYAHIHDKNVPHEETLRAFDELVTAGKARAIGASNYTRDALAEAVDTSRKDGLAEFRVLQQRYSYLMPRPDADLGVQVTLDEALRVYCADQQILPIAYSVLLAGAYTRSDKPLPEHYATAPRAQEHIDALHVVGRDLGVSPNTVVYAWLLATGCSALMGISTVDQLREALAADALPLPAKSLALLETVRNG
jgi:aryl-alcohol dehydrogenase-like predicted oxidoreductase